MSFAKMAWRNVWRNRRRTLVTVAAATFGLFVLIHYAGLFEGYLAGMERKVLELEVGDMQVFAEGYRDEPSLYDRLDDSDSLLAALDDAGYPACARLLGGGLVAAGDSSAGVSLRGVDVARDAKVSRIGEHVAEGTWLDPAEPQQVVLGRRLAKTLGVGPGAEVVVLSQAADGSTANELYQVRGILKSMSDAVDRTGMFMTTPAFRELLAVPTGAHQIIVRRPPQVELEAAAAVVRQLAPDHDVQTWRQLMPTIASYMDNSRGVVTVMFFIVYFAIGILILNAMLMAVFERIREFGVLKALGVGPGQVMRVIYMESGIQALLAVVVGSVLSIPGVWYLSVHGIDVGRMSGMSVAGVAWDPIWRAEVTPQIYTGPIVTLLVVVALAVFYPALKAALIRPVDAIHHQ